MDKNMLFYIRKKVMSYPYLNFFSTYQYFYLMDECLYSMASVIIAESNLFTGELAALVSSVSRKHKNSKVIHYFDNPSQKGNMRSGDLQFISEATNFMYHTINGTPREVKSLRINRSILKTMLLRCLHSLERYVQYSNRYSYLTQNLSVSNIEEITFLSDKMDKFIKRVGTEEKVLFGMYNQLIYYLQLYEQYYDNIYKSYLRVAYHEAKEIVKTRIDAFPDAFQNGSLGLMRAVGYFDVSKGKAFKTYAAWWVRKYILEKSEGEVSFIRIPNNTWRKYSKFEKFREGSSKVSRADVTRISKHMKVSEREVERVYVEIRNKQVDSLDSPISGNDSGNKPISLFEILEDKSVEKPDDILKSDDSTLETLGCSDSKIIKFMLGIISDKQISDIPWNQLRDEAVRQTLLKKEF